MAEPIRQIDDDLYAYKGHRIQFARPRGKKSGWVATVIPPEGDLWTVDVYGPRNRVVQQIAVAIDLSAWDVQQASNPYSMERELRGEHGLVLGVDEVFVKSGSHRATAKIKQRLGTLPTSYFTFFGRKKTAGTTFFVMTREQFGRVRDITGVSQAKIQPGERWQPSIKFMNPREIREHYTKADYPAIFGDSDRDSIEDVDDPHPYTPGDKHSIEEVRLADEVEALLSAREEFIPVARDMKSKLGALGIRGAEIKSRVKTPFSILNKLRRKRLATLTDIAGAMIVVPDQRALETAKAGIEKDFDVIGIEDYYSHPQNGYRALHYIVRQDGHPVELQLKTRRMAAIADASHTPYKRGQLDPKAMEELTTLAWKADKGDRQAEAQIDRLIADRKDLRRRLTLHTNPSRPRTSVSRTVLLAERLAKC
jgi:ppGpp synthetase/RelA/SpoT-type nucleotidyltranferase